MTAVRITQKSHVSCFAYPPLVVEPVRLGSSRSRHPARCNFLDSVLQIDYPGAAVLNEGWLSLLNNFAGLVIALIPNITHQWRLRLYFRIAIAIFLVLFFLFWFWFPIAVSGRFQPPRFIFQTFHNGINQGKPGQSFPGFR
jgi:hypothetical protein